MTSLRSFGAHARTVLAVVGAVAVLVLASGFSLFDLPNPLGSTEKVKQHPVLLQELQSLSRYTAATGRFQTIVDVEQDADYLPDFLKGERVTMFAEADVEAFVDFSGLGLGAIDRSADGTTVTITIPEPELTAPRLDHDATYVATRDRGLVDRFEDALTSGEPTDDQELYQRATAQLAEASEQSELQDRAKTNTRAFLEALLADLGVERVIIAFEQPVPSEMS
jgi:hypothetical protein